MGKRDSSNALILIALIIIAISCRKEEKPPDPVTDIEDNSYKTVRIGAQVWMAENLKTTRFNDGEEIALITDATSWLKCTTAGFCWYNNDETGYKDPYGALYNGYAVSTGKLCPTGWHIPEKEDFQILRNFLGDTISGGGKMKEAGTSHWLSPNKGADNSTGFTALPSGIRYFEGTFCSVLHYTCFWSATEADNDNAWYLSLYFGDASVNMSYISKKHGFAVRCVKN